MRVIRGPRTILALLTALNLLNYLDRFVLSAVLPKVKDELHLTNLVGGSLATVFLIGYFATSPVFGMLADRAGRAGSSGRGRKVLISVGVAVWSLATLATGLVHSAASLWVVRALVGVGEASYATIAPTLIDELAPPTRKARWLAIFYTATPVGSALGYIVGGGVEAATHDWRMAFFVAGVPGLLLSGLCLLIAEPERAREPATHPFRTSAAPAAPSLLASTRSLTSIPLFRNVVLGYCAYTFALGGFAYWAPTYLHERYGMETGKASVVFGLVTVASGTFGTLLGGWLADRRLRGRTDDGSAARSSLWVCALSAGLGGPLALAAILSPTATTFFALVLPCQVALFLSSGPVNAAILRSVPAGLRASAMAMSIFAIHMGGDLWSPPLIGFVSDRVPMAWAMLAGPAVFALAAFIWWRGSRLREAPVPNGSG